MLARAGGSIFEIAAAGRPAILVPYPHATADHQAANVRWMHRRRGGDLDRGLRSSAPESAGRLVGELLGDSPRLAEMAAASRGLARPDAAKRIAAEILATVESHG